MDPGIIAALITASATIIAALIARQSKRPKRRASENGLQQDARSGLDLRSWGKNWAPENNVVTNTNLSQREAAERTGLSKRQQALAWLAVAMWLGSFVIMFNVSSGFGLLVFVASYGVGYLATRGMTWRDALGMGDPREG
jgi:hypothetical protein